MILQIHGTISIFGTQTYTHTTPDNIVVLMLIPAHTEKCYIHLQQQISDSRDILLNVRASGSRCLCVGDSIAREMRCLLQGGSRLDGEEGSVTCMLQFWSFIYFFFFFFFFWSLVMRFTQEKSCSGKPCLQIHWVSGDMTVEISPFSNLIVKRCSMRTYVYVSPQSHQGRHFSHCPFTLNKAPFLLRPSSYQTCWMWYSPAEAYSSQMKESVSDAGGEDVTPLPKLSHVPFFFPFGRKVAMKNKMASEFGWKPIQQFQSHNRIGFIWVHLSRRIPD